MTNDPLGLGDVCLGDLRWPPGSRGDRGAGVASSLGLGHFEVAFEGAIGEAMPAAGVALVELLGSPPKYGSAAWLRTSMSDAVSSKVSDRTVSRSNCMKLLPVWLSSGLGGICEVNVSSAAMFQVGTPCIMMGSLVSGAGSEDSSSGNSIGGVGVSSGGVGASGGGVSGTCFNLSDS